jgi:predicted AAA+ superfamily ATPase
VLAVGGVKKPEVIIQLLTLLAFQMGNEVSYRELATQLKTSQQTIERYIDLLEKNFVIIRLPSFAKNLRNEVTRSKKVYFLDMGIRNALIDAWKPIDPLLRNDVGALFEACMIVERMKQVAHEGKAPLARYFWRTFAGQEIDYLEAREEQLSAYEFKWNSAKIPSIPRVFAKAYPTVTFVPVSPSTALSFVTEDDQG